MDEEAKSLIKWSKATITKREATALLCAAIIRSFFMVNTLKWRGGGRRRRRRRRRRKNAGTFMRDEEER